MQGITSRTSILISDWVASPILSKSTDVLYLDSLGWKHTIYVTDWRLLRH